MRKVQVTPFVGKLATPPPPPPPVLPHTHPTPPSLNEDENPSPHTSKELHHNYQRLCSHHDLAGWDQGPVARSLQQFILPNPTLTD